jgi:signal transduction histidine kinase/CheY-like chemotaxis protein
LGAIIPGNSTTQAAIFKIRLLVEPPLYLRPWFLFTLASCFGLLFVLATNIRQRRLLQLSRRLSREVADKTAQLKQERDVIASQKEALLRLDEEKTRFFQDLSHEFRNPLTLIIGPVTQILKRNDLPAGYRDPLERVLRNARKILHLIGEVLELSKLEAGMVPLENGVAPLADFIVRICQDIKSIAAQKNISFHLTHTLPPRLVVQTDVQKLEKILINLIQNALKFTPSGGSVQVDVHWEPNGILQVSVQDTGIGIAPEHLPKIFERFYQISTGTNLASNVGFGIGLAMCRHYATLMGGSIEVQSSPGKGTTMHLSLPCREMSIWRPPKLQKHPDAIPGRKPSKVTKARILLVDDHPEIIDYVTGLLEPPHKIISAKHITEAFQLLQTQAVDLVLCDHVLAGGTGLELLAQMRREEGALRHLPFVFLTANGTPEVLLEAGRLQFNGLINKPVCEPELLEMVQGVLSSLDAGEKV